MRTGREEGGGLRKWTEERGLEVGELGERRMDGGEGGWVVGGGRGFESLITTRNAIPLR